MTTESLQGSQCLDATNTEKLDRFNAQMEEILRMEKQANHDFMIAGLFESSDLDRAAEVYTDILLMKENLMKAEAARQRGNRPRTQKKPSQKAQTVEPMAPRKE